MVTQSELQRVLNYDPSTGFFTWKVHASKRVRAGDVAGTLHGRYRRVKVGGKLYYAHVLAWVFVYGAEPEAIIDHVNNDGLDNRIANLRRATHSQNKQNSRLHRNNTSGVKGVYAHKDRWKADISAGGKKVFLGVFDSFEGAVKARRDAEILLHGEFRRAA